MLPLVWELHRQAEQKEDFINGFRQQLGAGCWALLLPVLLCLHRGTTDKKQLQGPAAQLHTHTAQKLKEFNSLSGQSGHFQSTAVLSVLPQ